MLDSSDSVSPDRSDTIETIAAELNTSSIALLRVAHQLRIHIAYDGQPLNDRDAENIRTLYAITGGAGLTRPDDDPELDTMRTNLGIDRYRLRGHRPRDRSTPYFHRPRPPRPRTPRSPLASPQPQDGPLSPRTASEPSNLACAAVAHWPHMPDAVARGVAMNWTKIHGFTTVETIAWWDAGLQFGHPEVARQLVSYGIKPAHLSIVIRNETVGTRLREGRLNARQVADLLHQEGHLHQTG